MAMLLVCRCDMYKVAYLKHKLTLCGHFNLLVDLGSTSFSEKKR